MQSRQIYWAEKVLNRQRTNTKKRKPKFTTHLSWVPATSPTALQLHRTTTHASCDNYRVPSPSAYPTVSVWTAAPKQFPATNPAHISQRYAVRYCARRAAHERVAKCALCPDCDWRICPNWDVASPAGGPPSDRPSGSTNHRVDYPIPEHRRQLRPSIDRLPLRQRTGDDGRALRRRAMHGMSTIAAGVIGDAGAAAAGDA